MFENKGKTVVLERGKREQKSAGQPAKMLLGAEDGGVQRVDGLRGHLLQALSVASSERVLLLAEAERLQHRRSVPIRAGHLQDDAGARNRKRKTLLVLTSAHR